MKTSAKRPIAILLIICVSILLGFLINLVWTGMERALFPKDYNEIIERYSKEYNVPSYIVAAVIKVESGFDPNAESNKGARGLMQMTPSTFEWLTGEEHLGEFLPKSKLYDPEVNIRYGTYYLHYLQSKFQNWDTTLAAYNGGEGNVANWLKNPEYSDGSGALTHIPFKETRDYVKKVNSAMDTYKRLYEIQPEVIQT